MFSSSNSANPLPHLPSSFHLSPPLNTNEMFLQHHKDLLVGHYLSSPTNAHQVLDTSVSSMIDGSNQALNGDLYDHSNSFPRKKRVKKDRHSKISTAKGPRERRVRLSIGVARRFFDLQDMLGFDKASKTLDWLFAKSRTAITDLVHMNHRCNGGSKSSPFASECVVVSTINEATDNGVTQGMIVSNKKALRPHQKPALRLLSRESRAKARERARERTREKMCTRSRVNESHKNISNSSEIMSHPQLLLNQAPRDHDHDEHMIDHESIVMTRKLEPSLLFDYELQDLSNYSPNFTAAIARSSFCVMTASMNLSTEFQIYGKPWEVYNNHTQL